MIELLLNYFTIYLYFPGFDAPLKDKFYDIYKAKFYFIYWNDVMKAANNLAIGRVRKSDN